MKKMFIILSVSLLLNGGKQVEAIKKSLSELNTVVVAIRG